MGENSHWVVSTADEAGHSYSNFKLNARSIDDDIIDGC